MKLLAHYYQIYFSNSLQPPPLVSIRVLLSSLSLHFPHSSNLEEYKKIVGGRYNHHVTLPQALKPKHANTISNSTLLVLIILYCCIDQTLLTYW